MIFGMQFLDNTLYLYDDARILFYDETATQDYTGSQQDIVKQATLNNFNPQSERASLSAFGVKYSSSAQILLNPVVDGVSSYGLTEDSGSDKVITHVMKRGSQGRGDRFALDVRVPSGTIEIFEMTMYIEDTAQRRLVRNLG